MVAHGYEWGETGCGPCETLRPGKGTNSEPADNSCSKARVTSRSNATCASRCSLVTY